MTAQGYTLFETAIGSCGIAWGTRGILGVQLPEGGDRATRARLQRRFPDARETRPPRDVQHALDGIVALLRGEGKDLSAVVLDMGGVPPFHRRVYEAARTIPAGRTLSYGEVAARIGSPGSARAVGQALGRNPFAIIVPCHRVLAAGGKTGGFSANGGTTTKLRMLAIEGAPPAGNSAPRAKSTRRGSSASPQSDGQPGLFDGDGKLGFDPRAAIKHLRTADPALARLIDKVGPFALELKKTSSVFGALAEAIVYQQLSGKAAATIYGRVCGLFPRAAQGPTAEHILGASDAKLRGAGLSGAKTLALRDLARKAKAGAIPTLAEIHRMTDADIVECLTAVRGIGRWTAEMLLIFRLGRPDVLPTDDYGVRKGFALAYRKRALPPPKDLEKYGERWRPYRTVASWYFWRALELPPR